MMWSLASKYFFNGLFVLLPLFITIWLLAFLFSFMDGILGGIISVFFGRPLPGVGFLATLSLILLTGYFADYILGEKILRLFEAFICKVPIVKSIYSSAKQVNEALFQSKGSKGLNKACLVEYPRKGIYSVGFITAQGPEEAQSKTGGQKLLCIFIPNTPTPATGFLIMVPESEVIPLDMKTDEAFKLIVSAGVLKPKGA
ncbi:MAG: DUF502 domain-containing protein [Candidatus Margulisiibacteriota bacterium]